MRSLIARTCAPSIASTADRSSAECSSSVALQVRSMTMRFSLGSTTSSAVTVPAGVADRRRDPADARCAVQLYAHGHRIRGAGNAHLGEDLPLLLGPSALTAARKAAANSLAPS